jgi:hypothetical protein
MRNIFKYLAVIFVAAVIISASSSCHCDDSSQSIKTFRGQILEVDWAGSLLVCQAADEISFHVPSGIRIKQGGYTVSFADLEQGDFVLIKYTDDSDETPNAVSISVNKSYPTF